MKKIFFSNPSHLQIQGEKVLKFLSVDNGVTKYQLIGFDQIPVIISDYRKIGLQAIRALLEGGDPYDFHPVFNQPALLTLRQHLNGQISIKLKETWVQDPAYMLWISIGYNDRLPRYRYLLRKSFPYNNGSIALLALYQRPYWKQKAIRSHQRLSVSDIRDNQNQAVKLRVPK